MPLINVGLENLENPWFGGWKDYLNQSKTDANRWEDGKNVEFKVSLGAIWRSRDIWGKISIQNAGDKNASFSEFYQN